MTAQTNSSRPGVMMVALGLWFAAVTAYQLQAARNEPEHPESPAEHTTSNSRAPEVKVEAPTVIATVPIVVPPHLKPGYNFALASRGAKATGGINPEQLIDGNSTQYDGSNGYGHTFWAANPTQSMVIELKDAPTISCVRFLLWDGDDRFYRYKLEISGNDKNSSWSMMWNKSGNEHECRGWQTFRFGAQSIKYIKLTGTYNSANSGFHVVEIEACIFPEDGFEPERKQPVPNGKKPSTVENLVF